jgi:hypothetical protein
MPVYDIRASPADSHFGCRAKDNTPPQCKPQAFLTAARRQTPNSPQQPILAIPFLLYFQSPPFLSDGNLQPLRSYVTDTSTSAEVILDFLLSFAIIDAV